MKRKACLQLLLYVFSTHLLHGLQMYDEPLDKNASLGSLATFSCNISGNTGISWLVDEMSHNDASIKERGISSQDYYNEVNDSTKSILTVTCGEQNNNTLLQCIGYSNGQFAKSSKVVLRIQGYLGPVSGFLGTQVSPTTAVFNWSKPYSLQGVPVLGYQVLVAVVESISGQMISYNQAFLNDTNYTATRTQSVSCTHVNITVFAVNSVGPGQPTLYNFNFIESPLVANWTIINVHKQYVSNELHLVIMLAAGNVCAQAIPSTVSLVLDDDTLPPEVCNVSDSQDVQVVENITTLALLTTLQCSSLLGYGSKQTGALVLSTIGGTTIIPGLQFDTNVVMNVSITTGYDHTGMLCITCVFVPGVHNMFCSVTVEDDKGVYQTFSVFQEDGSRNGTGCTTGLSVGVYSICVCNTNCTVHHVSQIAYICHNLSIIGVEPSSSHYTSTSSQIKSMPALPAVNISGSPTPVDNNEVFIVTKAAMAIFGAVGTVLVLTVMTFIIIVSVICYIRRKKKLDKIKANPTMSRNEAYSSVFFRRESNNVVHVIDVKPSMAYGVVVK